MNKEYLSSEKAKMLVKILGIIQLTIGFFSLALAPIEIYCYYLFSEGGRFHYDGFKIGAFLYGLIFAQIIAFYFIGFLFIMIGYGHLKLKKWTLNLSISCIWFWIIFGLPIMIFFLPLFTTKEINTQHPILLLTGVSIILLVIIPKLLLMFYRQMSVKELFTANSESPSGIRNMSVSGYLLLIVYCLYILIFHIMMFYNGLFPLFGKFLTGLNGIVFYSLSVIIMILLIYGLIKRVFLLWITSLFFFILLIISTSITMFNYQYVEIIDILNFPKLENDILRDFPLKSLYFIIPIICILLITIIIIFRTKSYHDNKIKYGI